jgi:hypothetical protein
VTPKCPGPRNGGEWIKPKKIREKKWNKRRNCEAPRRVKERN